MISYPDPGKICVLVNHQQEPFGMGGPTSPGGRGKEFGANSKMRMYRKDSKFDSGAFLAELKIEKLRWGGTDRERTGRVFIIPGYGIARGITAVLDADALDLVTRSGGWVKYKDESEEFVSTGYRFNALMEEELAGNMEPFEPIFKLLEEHYEGIPADSTGNGEDVPDTEDAEGG
jgi:hypothetical protein